MAAEGEAPEHEEPQQQEFAGTEAGWDDPGGEPGDLSSLSAQTEWLNQQVSAPRLEDGRDGDRHAKRSGTAPWPLCFWGRSDPGLLQCPRRAGLEPGGLRARSAASPPCSLHALEGRTSLGIPLYQL